MKIFIAYCLLIGTSAFSIDWIIPSIRLPDTNAAIPWNPGVSNGVPFYPNCVSVMDYGANADGLHDDYSAFTNAISHCTNGGAVYVPTGNYVLSNEVDLTYVKRFVIRGDGANIKSYSGTGSAFQFGSDTTRTTTYVTGGFQRGSTNLLITNSIGLIPGQWARFLQDNDSNVWGSVSSPSTRWQSQCVRIASVSSTNVTLYDPIYYPYYNLAANPYFEQWHNSATRCGLEGLGIWYGGSANRTVYFSVADECWVCNCSISNSANYGIEVASSYACTISSNIVVGVQTWLGSSQYGIYLNTYSGKCLVENNIAQGFATAILLQGCAGNVVSYNFANVSGGTDAFPQSGGISAHGNNSTYNLFEGNAVPWWSTDCTWGDNKYPFSFRNWLTRIVYTNLTTAFASPTMDANFIDATNYTDSAVGNILGMPSQFGDTRELNSIGIIRCVAPGNVLDTNVGTGLFWHGNFNYVTNITQWSNSVSQVLPASYYLSSRPSWWSANLAWPPIGPDVPLTISTAITNYSLIPAQQRYTGLPGNYGQLNTTTLRVGTISKSQ